MANTTNNTKRTPAIEAEIAEHGENGGYTGSQLTLTFSNGQILRIGQSDISTDIQRHAMMHGLKQKLVDAAAIARNPETGRAATVEDKYNAVKTVYDRLLAGQWNAPREGGGNGGLLFQALVRMYHGKKTAEDIKTYLESKTDAEKTALRKNPKVATYIEIIREETGKTSGIDSDELLAGLED